MVSEIHKLFNEQKRYSFPFDVFIKEIPANGIYILFEKGEKYGDYDRIVYVGKHSGKNRLYLRLNEHFVKENKNRSIFRDNIGRCFLNQGNHPYLQVWKLNITSRAVKEENLKRLDLDFEKQMENIISNYIQTNFSFCIFRVDTKEERDFWKRKIASALANSSMKPSSNWLGNSSPEDKIRETGLWKVKDLSESSLTTSEFSELQDLVKGRTAKN